MPMHRVQPSRILERAFEILSDPSRWTTGSWAKDANGIDVHPVDPSATCYCVEGAVVRAAADLGAVAFDMDEVENWFGEMELGGEDIFPSFRRQYKFGDEIQEVLQESAEAKGFINIPTGNDDGGYEVAKKMTSVARTNAHRRGI